MVGNTTQKGAHTVFRLFM